MARVTNHAVSDIWGTSPGHVAGGPCGIFECEWLVYRMKGRCVGVVEVTPKGTNVRSCVAVDVDVDDDAVLVLVASFCCLLSMFDFFVYFALFSDIALWFLL